MSTLMKMKMQPETLDAVIAAKAGILQVKKTEENIRNALYFAILKDLGSITRQECDEFIDNFEIEGLV